MLRNIDKPFCICYIIDANSKSYYKCCYLSKRGVNASPVGDWHFFVYIGTSVTARPFLLQEKSRAAKIFSPRGSSQYITFSITPPPRQRVSS